MVEHPTYPAEVRTCVAASCDELKAVAASLRGIVSLATPAAMDDCAESAADRIEEVVRRLMP